MSFLATLLLAVGAADAQPWHPVEDVSRAAVAFLEKEIGDTTGQTTLRAAALDPRMQLSHCTERLQGHLQRGAKLTSKMVVGVRCTGAKPWKVYVTVDVLVREPVLVAAKTLARGHVVEADDVKLMEHDVATLRSGYLTAPEAALGKRLKLQLLAGRVLTPRMLAEEIAVRRGQSVTLTVRSDALAIRMAGKALMDGHINQRIRVENTHSKRIVEGIVRGPELVEVLVF